MTHTETILAHLLSGRSITPIDALRDYGCFRLAARVKEIREAGYEVKTIMEGEGAKKWARYTLTRATQ